MFALLAKGHDWDLTPAQAIDLQNRLRQQVIARDDFGKIRHVAGVDVGFEDDGSITRAAVVILDYRSLELLDVVIAREETRFPYIPGLLSFRELPAVLAAVKKLKQKPDIYLCDGQGYAHPRRFGIACHLGVLTNTPAIGVGKTRLLGKYRIPADRKGDWQPLIHEQETIGAVLRTRIHVKPIFVSIGHRICLASAVATVMKCVTRYKLPETTRLAHHYASREKEFQSG